MAVGDLYRLAFNINCAGEETTCVLGYLQTTGTNDANTLELTCQAFIDDDVGLLQEFLSGGVSVDRVKMDTVTDHQEVPGLVDMNGFSGVGLEASMPAQMSALVHLGTIAPNAKHNGRIYIAGLPIDSQVGGTIIPGELTKIQTFADALGEDLEPGGGQSAIFTPVVISRFLDGEKRTPPIGFHMNGASATPSMRQQRKRKTPHFGLR